MKKVLVAAAVASAFAGGAYAQNVSVYGLIDASVAQVKTGVTTVTAQGQGDYLGSSVLGFKGSEDLGGGMKASFQLEGDLNVNNGAGDGGENSNTTSTSNATGGLTFDRQSWVGISGSFGAIRVGRMSDFVDSTYGKGQGANLFDLDSGSLGSKHPNQTEFSTKIAGQNVQVNYSNDTAAVAAGTGQGTQYSSAGIAGSMNGVSYRLGVAESGAKSETVISLETAVAGINLGLMANKTDQATYKTGNTSLAAAYSLGGGNTLKANIQRHSNDTTATSRFTAYGVLIQKDFSKRTSAYAGYSSKNVNNGTASDVETTVIGLQHAF